MDRLRMLFVAVLMALASCGGATRYVSAAPKHAGTLRLWIQDDPLITADMVLEGCRFWEPVGVRCERVSRQEDADIRVYVSHEPCLSLARKRLAATKAGTMAWTVPLRRECRIPFPEDGVEITEAWGMAGLSEGGKVTIFPSCIAWSGNGMIVPDVVRRTAAHEIGHEMGIGHVAPTCDDACTDYLLDAKGARICGQALMNAPTNQDDYITPVDAAAFRRRRLGSPPHAK